jgi:hypothetical protein
MERKAKIPLFYDIGDYDRNPDVYKKHDYDPFDETWPSWIKGKPLRDVPPEWWIKKNEDHAAAGRTMYREFYFKGLIKTRKFGTFMRGFMSLGRSFQEAHDGLLVATGWHRDPSRKLIDIDYSEYRRLKANETEDDE